MTTWETKSIAPERLSCEIKLPGRTPVIVHIHDTQDLMQSQCGHKERGTVLANCRNFLFRTTGKPHSIEINFYKDGLGAGIVAHEAFHAALQMARWRKVSALPSGKVEETIAIDIERIVKAFWGWWYDEAKTDGTVHHIHT